MICDLSVVIFSFCSYIKSLLLLDISPYIYWKGYMNQRAYFSILNDSLLDFFLKFEENILLLNTLFLNHLTVEKKLNPKIVIYIYI